MKGRQRGIQASRTLRHIALAACCALGVGWFWNVPTPIGPAASAQPEVRNVTAREAGISRDATVLARRILLRQSRELLVDERRVDRLGREIGTVLRLIRDRYPVIAEIGVRQRVTELSLEIEGALLDDIAERWTDLSAGAVLSASAVLPTGHAGFDDLGARLGLRTIEFWPASDVVLLRFGERANPRALAEAYSAVAGVAHARLVRDLIDGSDVAVFEMDGIWFAVMRKAWGDCPRGCINKETYFFTVKSGEVERIEEEAARATLVFRMVEKLARLGW